ncbi:hypothetical protein LUW74_04935 [Actinomadura madurae]|nr:hypothetical protein [Actinomadura madurae]URN02767.1 hypothetical protein LUW74_04935 [Actinomadura madurae]
MDAGTQAAAAAPSTARSATSVHRSGAAALSRRGHGEGRDARAEDAVRAVPVGDGPGRQEQRPEHDGVAGDGPLQARDRPVQRAGQVGFGHGQDGRVEQHHEVPEGDAQQGEAAPPAGDVRGRG